MVSRVITQIQILIKKSSGIFVFSGDRSRFKNDPFYQKPELKDPKSLQGGRVCWETSSPNKLRSELTGPLSAGAERETTLNVSRPEILKCNLMQPWINGIVVVFVKILLTGGVWELLHLASVNEVADVAIVTVLTFTQHGRFVLVLSYCTLPLTWAQVGPLHSAPQVPIIGTKTRHYKLTNPMFTLFRNKYWTAYGTEFTTWTFVLLKSCIRTEKRDLYRRWSVYQHA